MIEDIHIRKNSHGRVVLYERRLEAETDEDAIKLSKVLEIQLGTTAPQTREEIFSAAAAENNSTVLDELIKKPVARVTKATADPNGVTIEAVRIPPGTKRTTMPAWQRDEDEYLAAHYGQDSAQEIADHLGRALTAVYTRAQHLGLKGRKGRKPAAPKPQKKATHKGRPPKNCECGVCEMRRHRRAQEAKNNDQDKLTPDEKQLAHEIEQRSADEEPAPKIVMLNEHLQPMKTGPQYGDNIRAVPGDAMQRFRQERLAKRQAQASED